jgi:hypothetical protein
LFLISDDCGGSGFLFLASFLVTFHVGTEGFESNKGSRKFLEGVHVTGDESKETEWEESAAVVLLFVIFLIFFTVVFLIFLVFLSVFVVFLVFLSVFVVSDFFLGISFESDSVG